MDLSTLSPQVKELYELGDKFVYDPEWPDYVGLLGLTREHIPELVSLLNFDYWLDMLDIDDEWDERKMWAPVHAWRALAQIGGPEVVDPLLQVLHKTDELDDDWILNELPQALAMIGPDVLPPLAAFLKR